MNKKDFLSQLNILRQDYKKAKEDLYLKFAEENNPYKIGDIVSDYYHTIRIRKIKYYFPNARAIFNDGSDFPTTTYIGTELNLEFSPKRIQKNIYMCLVNVKEKLN